MRERLIQIASQEIGYKEKPTNKTKFGSWFGFDGNAWCAMFVSWVYDQAGINLGKIDFLKGMAGTNYAMANVHKWGKVVTKPEQGDVVFFDWQKDGKYDHVGIFLKDLGNGMFESIEGNTSLANDSNGGCVMKRVRRYGVATFVRPNVLK